MERRSSAVVWTLEDVVLWREADGTIFGYRLGSPDRQRMLDPVASTFLGILPKNTPIHEVVVSSFEGHYACRLGTANVQLPSMVVDNTSPAEGDHRMTAPLKRPPKPTR
jgi:hypothetical protein